MDDYKEIATVEQVIWDIWQFVRENKDSLDSERCTAKIRALVDQATADIRTELKALRTVVRLGATELQEARDSAKEETPQTHPVVVISTSNEERRVFSLRDAAVAWVEKNWPGCSFPAGGKPGDTWVAYPRSGSGPDHVAVIRPFDVESLCCNLRLEDGHVI